MKNIKYILFAIVISVFIFSYNSNAQLHISLGPSVGYTVPSGDLGSSTGDYYNGTKYGLSPGIDFGAMGKLGLGPLNFRLSLLYTPLSNNGISNESPHSVDIKMHFFTIGIGTEYGFGVPLAPVKPYIGLDLLFTTISGSFQFQGTPNLDSSPHDMNTASKVGLGIAAGVNLQLLTTSIDVSLRYNMLNLFSKRYEGPSNSNQRLDLYLYLNDDKDPNYSSTDPKHPIGNSRTIATIQLQLGVMFGF